MESGFAALEAAAETAITTAVLEAGRRSLDSDGAAVTIEYRVDGAVEGLR